MDTPLQVTFRDIPFSPVLDEKIRRKAAKLGALARRLVGCRVILARRDHRHRHGSKYAVHIDVRLPAHEIVVSHEADEDLYAAVRDAFAAAARRLKELA